MATPVIGIDGDVINAAMVQKALTSNGKLAIKVLYCRAYYTGAAWNVRSTVDSSQLVTANLAWSTNKVVVTLTGYTATPVVLVTQGLVTIPYVVQAAGVSSTSVEVRFYDMAGALIAVQDTSLEVNLLILGV